MPRHKSVIETMPTIDYRDLLTRSTSIKDVLLTLGFRANSGSMYNKVKKRASIEGISLDHMEAAGVHSRSKREMSSILVENSTYTNIDRLKKRLIKEGILEYVCSICENTGEWLGKKLTLQLDHIDGNPRNHTRDNLRFICPNCHSQTETFSGRNKVA